MNRKGILIVVVIAGFVLAGWALIGAARSGRTSQPIAFNHKLHKEAGLECVNCHVYVETERYAGKPTLQTCLECHEEAMTESPEEEKIRQYAKEKKEIPWRKISRTADHVFFTHQRHVVGAGMACATCHGNIGETTKSPSKPLKTLSMDDCMDCHRKNDANNDCLACHW
ncbi:MAG: hypothetical protein GTN81_17780 [Proteobacteria bacterium]|nr:hypothetical protein [Pseudomonadota bacterium]